MGKDLKTTWDKVLNELQPNISVGNFNTFLKTTNLVSLEDGIATISTNSLILVDILQKRFAEKIKTAIKNQTGENIEIFLTVGEGVKKTKIKDKEMDSPLFDHIEDVGKLVKPLVGHLPRVRPEYTFSNFAVSSTNQLAFVSAQRVSDKIGESYNPLFIYGPVGVGKTHLVQAIANNVYLKNPDKKIIYITSEEFTNEVVEAIRNNDTSRMKKRFRSAYLLMIDDIQFIEGKEKVQEELFHTFNILIDNGSQICLTSDRPPHEIKKLEARLSSRFAGGLTVDIGKPDLELKTAIVKKKAEKFGFELPTDVALFLAENAEDTRSLEGLLLRIVTQITTRPEPVTLQLAEQALKSSILEKRQRLHPDDVINFVCDFYNVKTTQLKGPKRDAFLVKARQVCMYVLKQELGLPLVEIGNLLGGRDHTTIMHGVEKMKVYVEKQAQVSEDILGITKSIRG